VVWPYVERSPRFSAVYAETLDTEEESPQQAGSLCCVDAFLLRGV
jgi:hypothetical protein